MADGIAKSETAANANVYVVRCEVDKEDRMTFESENPATGELIGTYPEHDEAETNVRLQRAWDGWRHWFTHVPA
jgi:acyl-CoA reductase-like NAD-dependent aldehyde dehydrogenase